MYQDKEKKALLTLGKFPIDSITHFSFFHIDIYASPTTAKFSSLSVNVVAMPFTMRGLGISESSPSINSNLVFPSYSVNKRRHLSSQQASYDACLGNVLCVSQLSFFLLDSVIS